MVFFTCDGCGEMLKKNKVDAHASRCRRCDSVSCIDCFVSFWGDDYRMHTSCITEAERYEGTSGKPKKTKRNPQEEWMSIVDTCASSAPSHLSHYMQTMTTLDNIPRKEKQFVNFASNSLQLRGRNINIVQEIWGILRKEREKRIAEKERIEKEKKESIEKEKEKQQQEKEASKTKTEEKKTSNTDKKPNDDAAIDAKKVKKITKKTLKKAPNRTMGMKELRKLLGKEMDLPKSAKKRLKAILLETAKASKDKIIIDGKLLRLSE